MRVCLTTILKNNFLFFKTKKQENMLSPKIILCFIFKTRYFQITYLVILYFMLFSTYMIKNKILDIKIILKTCLK